MKCICTEEGEPSLKRLENKWILACLAFLVPAVLLLIVFAVNGVTPFGGRSLAEQDANIQYIEFFNYYRNIFHGEDTLLYSFTNFLGGSGVALFAYYLASPFNLLILAVPASMNHALFSLMVLLKLSLCGFTMTLFLRERFPKLTPLFTLLLSVSYALMQYNIAQTMNIMWLDGVYMLPLILSGVYRLVRTGKSFLFLFSTAAAILFNWYAGYFDCIAAILFFAWELGDVPEGLLTARQKWGRLGSALGHGVAAALMSAVLFLPSIITLLGGKGKTDIKMDFGFTGNPLTSLAGFSLGTESFDGGMSVFCGSLVTLALLLYFTNRQFALKEKIRSGVLLVVGLLLAYYEPLAFIANGFRNITSYWYRYGYVVIAFLIFLAAHYYAEVEGETKARLYKAALAGSGILFLVEFVSEYGTLSYIFGTSLFLLAFAWALTKLLPLEEEDPKFASEKAKKWIALGLTAAVSLELAVSASLIYRSTGFSKVGRWQDYHANRTEKVASVKAADNGFYRFAQTDYRHRTTENLTAYFDDSYSYAYPGIAHYSSTYSNNQAELMCHLGYASDPTVPVTTTRLLASDSLLSVKYVLGEPGVPGLEAATDLGEGIWRNPFAVNPALVVKAGEAVDYEDYKDDPFSYQNALYSQLLGRKVRLYQQVDITSKRDRTHDRFVYTIPQQPENMVTYLSVATRGWAHGKLYVGDKFLTEYAYWLTPQAVLLPQKTTTSQKTTVKYQYISGENKIGKAYCYSLDLDELAAVTTELNTKTATKYDFGAGNVSAVAIAESDSEKLFLSVPVDRGWTVKVNDVEVEPEKLADGAFADCFYLIPLNKGENNVRMTYQVPGLTAGAVITLVTFLASVALAIVFRKRDAE